VPLRNCSLTHSLTHWSFHCCLPFTKFCKTFFSCHCMVCNRLSLQVAVVYWSSGNMSDCGVRGLRVEFDRRHLCFSWHTLRYTAFGTGCTPLLQYLGRLSLPPSGGWQNECQLLRWVIIINDDAVLWTVASELAWFEGWWPSGTQCTFIKWTRWTLALASPWQRHKHVIGIIRPHRCTTYIGAAYCYRPSSVVCRSVDLSH